MDPNVCLKRLKEALADGDREEATEARIDLREWVAKGGFPPDDPDWRSY